jgi:hypothetical protein
LLLSFANLRLQDFLLNAPAQLGPQAGGHTFHWRGGVDRKIIHVPTLAKNQKWFWRTQNQRPQKLRKKFFAFGYKSVD